MFNGCLSDCRGGQPALVNVPGTKALPSEQPAPFTSHARGMSPGIKALTHRTYIQYLNG
jgi:hypothetical protein